MQRTSGIDGVGAGDEGCGDGDAVAAEGIGELVRVGTASASAGLNVGELVLGVG